MVMGGRTVGRVRDGERQRVEGRERSLNEREGEVVKALVKLSRIQNKRAMGVCRSTI